MVLFIFSSANDLVLWGFYVHFPGYIGTLKFYEYTDRLAPWTKPAEGSRPLDAIFKFVFTYREIVMKLRWNIGHEWCQTTGKMPQWASCQIRKIAGAHAPGMPGTFSPSPHVSDPDMHHGTCVTHVPWCMPGSLTSGFILNRRRGETFPAFPAHAQPAILRIW